MPEYEVRATNLDRCDAMTRAYLEAAEWCGLYDNVGLENDDVSVRAKLDNAVNPKWSRDSLAQARRECRDFLASLTPADRALCYADPSRAGHDFYLTRNHHGAGFWDGPWPYDVGQRMTALAHPWGSQNVEYDSRRARLHLIDG